MRVSHEWLSEFVDLDDLAPARVADLLTMSGTEVERIDPFGHGLEELVVAEVVGLERLQGSDHLWLALVSIPGQSPAEVVCGAPNLSEGALVAWARPGTSLPGGTTIGQRRIRGQLSQGMLCAPDELGLGSDHEGVLILPLGEVAPGQPLSQVFPPDTVYDLEILSNRGDCLCHWGVARELAAVLDRPLRDPELGPTPRIGEPAPESVEVVLEDQGQCPLYLAECLELSSGGASPLWLQRRLLAVGSRPISAVVDLANYVMLELGQPVHTFDLDRLRGGPGRVTIGVRPGRAGESLLCLDGLTRPIQGVLTVTSDDRPVALAGLIGGMQTRVGQETRSVVLEAASFDWVSIRRASRRLGLRTEASGRFERALSPALPRVASQRFVHLLQSLGQGSVRPGPVVGGAEPPAPAPLQISSGRIGGLLGLEVAAPEAAEILRRLQFQVSLEGDRLRVTPPVVRTDVRIPEDLIEEVGRVIGYDRVPATLPALRSRPGGKLGQPSAARLAGELCLGAGFSEALSSSLVSLERIPPILGMGQGRAPSTLSNPLSSQLGALRLSCLPGLLDACQLNQARGQERTRLFEWGRAFWQPPEGRGRPEEPELLGLADHASGSEAGMDAERLDHLLQLVQALGDRVGLLPIELRAADRAGLLPGRTAELWVEGELRGVVAELAPEVIDALELRGTAVVAELRVDGWLVDGGRPGRGVRLAKTPALSVDLAVTVPEPAGLGPATAAVRSAGIAELEQIRLIDQYRGDQLPEGTKGWTFRLLFRHPDRTLTHREGEQLRSRVLSELGRSVGAEPRVAP